MIKVLFVCHGNICRSTMAESLFTHIVNEKGIKHRFEIDSAGTSREEIGNSPHYGTVRKLKEKGVELVEHKARQITKFDVEYYDYIIAMDKINIRNLEKMFGKNKKFYKLLNFINSEKDVADPWYTDNFQETYDDILKGLEGFLEKLD